MYKTFFEKQQCEIDVITYNVINNNLYSMPLQIHKMEKSHRHISLFKCYKQSICDVENVIYVYKYKYESNTRK